MTLPSPRWFVTLCCLASLALAPTQAPAPRAASDTFYVLPLWLAYASADEDTFAREVADLRRRLGPETPRVRLGFTSYIFLSMDDWNVDVSSPAAVKRALAPNIAQIDAAIDRARRHGIPLCLEFITAVRERYDPLQKAAEQEDRRNMQWHADNTLARGWITHSRYARKHRRVLEAYVRALGRVVANRMARYPETFVAASGDGEVELAYDETPIVKTTLTEQSMQLADYSPFAVEEFRDWLRGGGLYAPGAPLSTEVFENSARYRGDASPAEDTNHDGHTLNGDYGTSFSTWALRYFDWPLADDPLRDPHAIPDSRASAPDWNALKESAKGGFDPPRTWKKDDPWWEIWHRFRQTMIWRHNRDVVRWATTSPDPETGKVVPADRWYSDQIPADYLHGATPDNPNLRFITSASAWWTADVSPFGRLGITSFNANVNGALFRTLAGVAPQIGNRDADWGILEWNASSPPSPDVEAYRGEMRLIRAYRPSLVVPVFWNEEHERIQGTGFEFALKELVADMSKDAPPPAVSATPNRLNFAVTADGRVTPAQPLHIHVEGRGRLAWTAVSSDGAVRLSPASGAGSADIEASIANAAQAAGDRQVTIAIGAPASSTPRITVPVTVHHIAGPSAAPYGSFDTPADGAVLPNGLLTAGGWTLDDVGVTKIEIWREPFAGEGPAANGLILLGEASRGARLDVAAVHPDAPLVDRAGWSFRYDLSPLAAVGHRTCRIHVLVTDVEGHVVDLGARSVTLN